MTMEGDVLDVVPPSNRVECVLDNRMPQKTVQFEENEIANDYKRKLYRRSKSEDPNLMYHSSLRPSLRMPLTRQKSIHDQEVRTPLLESEDEEDTPQVQIHFPAVDSTECGEDTTDGTMKKRRGLCRKPGKRHVIIALILIIIIGAVIFLYVKVHKVWY